MAVISHYSEILRRDHPPRDHHHLPQTANASKYNFEQAILLFYVGVIVIALLPGILLTLLICFRRTQWLDIEAQRVDRYERQPLLHRTRSYDPRYPLPRNEIQRAQERKLIRPQGIQEPPEGREYQASGFGKPQQKIQNEISFYTERFKAQILRTPEQVQLNRYRTVILKSLETLAVTSERVSDTSRSKYLNVQTLRTWKTDNNTVELIHFLILKAKSLDLSQIAETYLEPLLSQRPVLSKNFNSAIQIPMPTLPGGFYKIRSFLGALHFILHDSLPPNRTLGEYLEIFLLFTTVLSRALSLDLQSQQTHHTKIALMVCLATNVSKSRAVIGFNATAPIETRKQIYMDRREYIPVLDEIQGRNLGWEVEHCAEVEILAHLGKLKEGFREREGGSNEMVTVILVLDLKDRTALGACPQCLQLLWKMRGRRDCVILNLAPEKK